VPSRWRRGLATEAGRALLAHGFGVLGLERIVAITHPRNQRSRAVMERLGMTFERASDGRALGLAVPDAAVVLYAVERRAGGPRPA
jgi:RimJ/RimL family protein N-acetyltransferase